MDLFKDLLQHSGFKIVFAIILVGTGMIATPTYAAVYQPGETLNPGCLPTDVDCYVVPPLTLSGATTTVTSSAASFTATSTTASTLPYASTTALSVSGGNATTSALTLGSVNGILRAVAGVVQSTYVSLSSDITGVLGVLHGGTGISTAPSYGKVLLGNASGGYNLVATSSLGIVGGSASATTPGGSSNQIQFNSNGAFAGSSSLTFATTTGTLSTNGIVASTNGVTLASSLPSATTNTLYNSGSVLYWNGSVVGSSSGAFTSGNGSTTLATISDNVGIGTTSPWRTLSVNGSSDLGTNALAGSFTSTTTATSTFAGGVNTNRGYSVYGATALSGSNLYGIHTIKVGFSNSTAGTGTLNAFGYNNIVSVSNGNNALAFGQDNTASASGYKTNALAFGYNNTVSNGNFISTSAAFGYGNTVSGSESSVFGSNISNSISDSTMIGPSNTAKLTILSTGETQAPFFTATSTTATSTFGGNLSIDGDYRWKGIPVFSTNGFGGSIGLSNTYSNSGFAVGNDNSVTQSLATAVGQYNTATGFVSSAIGYSNTSSGSNSVAMGYLNKATSTSSTAIGNNNNAGGATSVAVGYSNNAYAGGSVAVGLNITNNIADSAMFGPSNTAKLTILSTGETQAPFFTAASTTATSTFNGPVDIGVGTPDSLLTINGTAGATGIPFISIRDSSTVLFSINKWGNFNAFKGANFSGSAGSGVSSGTLLISPLANVNGMSIKMASGATANALQVIDSSNNFLFNVKGNGDIGIGTTTPWRTLSVNGSSDLGTNALAGSFTATSITATSTFTSGVNVGAGNGYFIGGTNVLSLNSGNIAVGNGNVSNSSISNFPSSAFGYNNTASGWASSAFGYNNTVSSGTNGSSAFGSNISNSISDSTMIGPSNTAKLTILSNGNMGIDTINPNSNLQVDQPTTGENFISTTAGGTTVTGSATQFLNTFKIGDTITAGTETHTITAIASNISMTTDAWTNAYTNNNYTLAGGTRFSVLGNGNIGIGTSSPASTLTVVGAGCFSKGTGATAACGTTAGNIYYSTANTGNYDVAEKYRTYDTSLSAGDIITLDTKHAMSVERATSSDVSFIGVVSTAPGVLLGGADGGAASTTVPVALSGRVPVKVSLANGPIAIGDRLTVSKDNPGVAVKLVGNGSYIGQALSSYSGTTTSTTGTVTVLINSGLYYELPSADGSRQDSSFGAITKWLASATNGIGTITAGVFKASEVDTKRLCVGSGSSKTCITKTQLDKLLSKSNVSSSSSNSGNGSAQSGDTSSTSPQSKTGTGTASGANKPASTTPPTITLLGSTPMDLTVGDTFTDPGATSTDALGNIISDITTSSSPSVDTSTAGTYTIIYTATDTTGNAASTTRSVVVATKPKDTTPPTITLLGSTPMDLTVGDVYTDPGATSADSLGKDISGSITTSSSPSVDTSTAGTYTIIYTATDTTGNAASTTRSVVVAKQ